MSERDELAADIVSAIEDLGGFIAWTDDAPEGLAEKLVAAGWRTPARTITTAEELEALPRLSVIRSDEGAVFERHTMWHEAGSRDLMYTSGIALPATVIWEPEPPRP